jgi:hypothetical protein
MSNAPPVIFEVLLPAGFALDRVRLVKTLEALDPDEIDTLELAADEAPGQIQLGDGQFRAMNARDFRFGNLEGRILTVSGKSLYEPMLAVIPNEDAARAKLEHDGAAEVLITNMGDLHPMEGLILLYKIALSYVEQGAVGLMVPHLVLPLPGDFLVEAYEAFGASPDDRLDNMLGQMLSGGEGDPSEVVEFIKGALKGDKAESEVDEESEDEETSMWDAMRDAGQPFEFFGSVEFIPKEDCGLADDLFISRGLAMAGFCDLAILVGDDETESEYTIRHLFSAMVTSSDNPDPSVVHEITLGEEIYRLSPLPKSLQEKVEGDHHLMITRLR